MIKEETIKAYYKQFQEINRCKFTEEGNELFIKKLVAETEQIDNMHVKTKINDLAIESDAARKMGGSGNHPSPMQLLLASIASCMEQTALVVFTFNGLNITSLKVKIEATYDKRVPLGVKPGFYDYKITWTVGTNEKESKVKRVLKKVESVCPVRGSLVNPKEFTKEVIIVE
ncbi:MAG: OsmC family protein [Candidatus Hodarchaeota archaeon]